MRVDQLAEIAGSFILSINNTVGARKAFGESIVGEVRTSYSISTAAAGGATRAGEFISNIRLPAG